MRGGSRKSKVPECHSDFSRQASVGKTAGSLQSNDLIE